MKKILICFLILSILVSLSSCLSKNAKYEDGDIVYNDNLYIYSNDKFESCFTPATETFNPRNYEDDNVLLGRTVYLNSIHSAWESDFGDNVLQDYGLGAWHGYYFKVGFELPDYKTLVIDEIFLKGESVVRFSNEEVLFSDIVDEEVMLQIDTFPQYYEACYATCKDYDSILLGGYHINIINGEVYIEIPEYGSNKYARVRDKYQKNFTDIIDKIL